MYRPKEDRLVLYLFIATGALLFWSALTLSTFARMQDFYKINFLLLQRDRVFCLAVFLASAGFTGLYRPSVISDRFDSLYYLFASLSASAVSLFVLAAVLPQQSRAISRTELVLTFVLASVVLPFWHLIAARLVRRFKSLRNYFYMTGNEDEGRRIASEILSQKRQTANAQYVPIETLRSIASNFKRRASADVILVQPQPEMLREIFEFCDAHFRRIFLYPALHDTLIFQQGRLLGLAGIPLIEVSGRQVSGQYLIIKRLMDILVSGAGILLVSPLCLIVAVAVKLTSQGPVFYLQERLGKDGKPFWIIKFRSMVSGNGNGNGYVRSGRDDSRITPVGRFIRKYRIDELPQLFNVLKGDMSLIGPRPLWKDFFVQNGEPTPLWERRLAVRPGLTSLSHVLGSSFAIAGDFLRYDLVYISTMSFLVDMRVLVATVHTVISGKGA
jgi:exopolysaccharide biosynthesis polyprenyl glycosylphosphotransferase